MKQPWILPVVVALFLFVPSVSAASPDREPYLSVRTGLRCSQCHTNRTGGGGRTAFGSVFAQTRLPIGRRGFRGRSLNDWLAIGGNLRLLASGTPRQSTPRTALAIPEANVQIEARLVPDVLSVYVDEIVGPNSASTREAFAMLEARTLDAYLKVGKFLLPYGLRLVDDTEFIRGRTGFNYATPDQGVEFGIEPAPLSLFVAVTNGTQGADENNNGKQVTGSAALIFRPGRIGVSASRNEGPGSRRDVYGGFAGFNLGRFTVLGEVDVIRDTPETGTATEQLAAYLEGNFLLVRGVNTKVTYGFLDPDSDIGENARTRARFGLELFPMPFLQVSTFYTLDQNIPQATDDLDRLSIEFHAFF